MKRNPRKDPVPGDVIEHPFGTHTVRELLDGIVHYVDTAPDGRVLDFVPIERWRLWYVGKRDCKVIKRGDE